MRIRIYFSIQPPPLSAKSLDARILERQTTGPSASPDEVAHRAPVQSRPGRVRLRLRDGPRSFQKHRDGRGTFVLCTRPVPVAGAWALVRCLVFRLDSPSSSHWPAR
jgi:hypothetical protein